MRKKKIEHPQEGAPVLELSMPVAREILKEIGSRPAESGGALGGHETSGRITHFQFDHSSATSAVTYSPDVKHLNGVFRDEWNPADVRLRGFVHSHPGTLSRPSPGDLSYSRKILGAIPDLDSLWLPIVTLAPEFRLTPWVAVRRGGDVEIVRGGVRISLHLASHDAEEDQPFEGRPGETLDELVQKVERPQNGAASRVLDSATFARVQGAYDLELLAGARIFAVGCGGSAEWLENMARAGVSQFVLVDPDIVSETNLATQQTYRRDIGRAKVNCVAERIRDINPSAIIVPIARGIEDLSDDEIRHLAIDPIAGRAAAQPLLCGLTDRFAAQARVNLLGLELQLPTLCAQVYREGRGAEITFTLPGITPACHRCILRSRYDHFLTRALANDVTSDGTPIFSTNRLNATKGIITLALLHHGSNHPRWGGLLERIGKRNLVQIRLDPDFAETIGIKVFDRVLNGADQSRLFFDDTLWLPQDQDCPETGFPHCPDCGGSGDLRSVAGRIGDTRKRLAQEIEHRSTEVKEAT